jgi:hypothetical protein
MPILMKMLRSPLAQRIALAVVVAVASALQKENSRRP